MAVTRIFDFAYQAENKYARDDAFATKVNNIWVKTSTKEFLEKANKVSRGLLKLGLKPGEKVGLISQTNRTEWAIMDTGLLQIGVISVPVYPTISEEDYEYIFNNAEIKYCFVSDKDLYHKLLDIKPKIKSLEKIFTFDEVDQIPNWKEVLNLGEDQSTQKEVDNISKKIKGDDNATLMYTSGTTGTPKGVMLTHRNIVDNVLNCVLIIKGVEIKWQGEKILSFLPLCHAFERMLLYFYLNQGLAIYFAESIDKIGDNLKEIKPKIMTVVPRLLEKVYDKIYYTGTNSGFIKKMVFLWALSVVKKYSPGKDLGWKGKIADKLVFSKWRQALGGNLMALVSGSAPLSIRLCKIFNGAGIPIVEGYGLTEVSPVIAVNGLTDKKFGTVGHPIANADVKIANDGEILVKGTSVFHGYYKDEEKTKEEFTPDGYFKTGDIGIIDEEGFLKITDRKKEIFKTSGGKYVAPQIIENYAKASKFIEQIMVVGDGEKMPAALIQPDFDFLKMWAARKEYNIGTTLEEMVKNEKVISRYQVEVDKLNTKLGHWEQVKRFELTPVIWSIDNGLLTPTLKLKRRNIKEYFIKLYNKIYDH